MSEAKQPGGDALPAFIGIGRVQGITGLSRSTIHRRIAASEFPQPVIAEGNCVRWDLAEVMAWRDRQFQKRAERLSQQPEQRAAA